MAGTTISGVDKYAAQGYVPYHSEDTTYFGALHVIEAEHRHLIKRRQITDPKQANQYINEKLSGLCLSGGGIRSASYSLGVLQALAYNGWLKKFDYLSTVSGGGYIGSSLTWLLSHKWHDASGKEVPVDVDNTNFPYGTYPMLGYKPAINDETVEIDNGISARHRGSLLRFLRQHGKYLTPGYGINALSLLGVILRGSVLSIFVYFTLLVLLFELVGNQLLYKSLVDFNLTPSWMTSPYLTNMNLALLLGIAGLVLFGGLAFVYSINAFFLSHRNFLEKFSYKIRRGCEKGYNVMLTAVILLLIAGCVPLIYQQFGIDQGNAKHTSMWAGITGGVSTAIGFISSIMTFMKTGNKKQVKIPIGILVAVGTITLLFGLLLTAYHFSLVLSGDWGIITGLGVVVLAIGWFANLNYICVHRYYRDRLMEAYMPDFQAILSKDNNDKSISANADKARLSQMCWYRPKEAKTNMNDMPYHIINANVVLVSSKIAKFKGRGGDNFILSPAYCGSNATGWRSTDKFMKDRMTLPTAMAISGAAVNPNTGVGGEGITRQPFLSMLMSLLNIRLGYWVQNPHPHPKKFNLKLTSIPNFLFPGLFEMIKRKYLEQDSQFLQLSDGGHFENLGLYEMIRRKTRFILCCDAAADPDYKFQDLTNALEKIRVDFGVLIDITPKHLEPLAPTKVQDMKSNKTTKATKEVKPYIVANILYPDGTRGTLIYLKSTLFDKATADLNGYKQSHPEFPNESTSDQFFDEKQFEAYRELGYQSAWYMMQRADPQAKKPKPPQVDASTRPVAEQH